MLYSYLRLFPDDIVHYAGQFKGLKAADEKSLKMVL